jgi:N-methylhydantoinase A/oxoprolinase/acetone carboxylase beta subunit
VLSALGLLVSERRRDVVESVLLAGAELTRDAIAETVERLARRGRDELGLDGSDPEVRASYDLRYAGQAFELTVEGEPKPDPDDLRRAFDEAHDERYGYADPEAELELVTVRVAVALPGAGLPAAGAPGELERSSRTALFEGEPHETAVLSGGIERVKGPAVCELAEATLVVPPGWTGGTDEDGTIVLEAPQSTR